MIVRRVWSWPATVVAAGFSFQAGGLAADPPTLSEKWGDTLRRLQSTGAFAAAVNYETAPQWCRGIVGSGHYAGYMPFYIGVSALAYYSVVALQIDKLDQNCEGTARFVIGPSNVPPGGTEPTYAMLKRWNVDRSAKVKVQPDGFAVVSGAWGTRSYWVTMRTQQRQMEYVFLVPSNIGAGDYQLKSAATYEEIPYDARQVASSQIQLPPDLVVMQPGPDVPTDLAAFVGVWEGLWGGAHESKLVIESVTRSGDVRGAYLWGDSLEGKRGQQKLRTQIRDGVLSWGNERAGIYFEFKMGGDGKLSGERYDHGGQTSSVTMTKAPSPSRTGGADASRSRERVLAFLRSIEIGAPDPAIPANSAGFLGRWQGRSSAGQLAVMAVKWITAQGDASVVQAWDDPFAQAGYRVQHNFVARVDNGVLWFYGLDGKYEFTITSEGNLEGGLPRSGAEESERAVTMYRLPDNTAAAPPPRGHGCTTQLWGGARINLPAADVPEGLRRWSGLYGGDRWDGVLCHSIAVLQVNKDGFAEVQYAWGEAPAWKIREPGFRTYAAKISGDTLTFAIPNLNANVRYKLNGDTLDGTWTSQSGVYRATLTKAR